MLFRSDISAYPVELHSCIKEFISYHHDIRYQHGIFSFLRVLEAEFEQSNAKNHISWLGEVLAKADPLQFCQQYTEANNATSSTEIAKKDLFTRCLTELKQQNIDAEKAQAEFEQILTNELEHNRGVKEACKHTFSELSHSVPRITTDLSLVQCLMQGSESGFRYFFQQIFDNGPLAQNTPGNLHNEFMLEILDKSLDYVETTKQKLNANQQNPMQQLRDIKE